MRKTCLPVRHAAFSPSLSIEKCYYPGQDNPTDRWVINFVYNDWSYELRISHNYAEVEDNVSLFMNVHGEEFECITKKELAYRQEQSQAHTGEDYDFEKMQCHIMTDSEEKKIDEYVDMCLERFRAVQYFFSLRATY